MNGIGMAEMEMIEFDGTPSMRRIMQATRDIQAGEGNRVPLTVTTFLAYTSYHL